VAPTAQTDPGFTFRSSATVTPEATYPPTPPVPPTPPNPPPSPLDQLVGTWKGTGFNTIWRPHFPSPPDRFLELNLTSETISFSRINGAIPNRGFLQADISMFGLTYLQQISDASDGSGLHIEPGIWVIVPETTDPAVPPSVVRMASIPHGTAIVAQGAASIETAPVIPDINIILFGINDPSPSNSDFNTAMATFPEMNRAISSQSRTNPLPPAITQEMVENPNSVLQSALSGRTVRTTTTLAVTSTPAPVPGGGTANTAFLQGAIPSQGGNADASSVAATFWVELVESPSGPDVLQLQYSQTVMLDFNGLHWPHVTVATLFKQ
jgi:hypothetical protein